MSARTVATRALGGLAGLCLLLLLELRGPWPGAAAAAGWLLAAALGALAVRLRRRLELVADAEHELRGPLTALGLGVEALRRPQPPVMGRRRLEALDIELGRVQLALDDLRAARAGRRAPSCPAPVALERLVRGAAHGWDPVARRAGGTVRLDWRAGPVSVNADRERLAQVFGNLLANAVEHGGAEIEVRGVRVADGVRVEVRDRGPGFGASRTGSGRGRGLRIAQDAARTAGGHVSVRSAESGATVAVELPVTDP